jgi:hypothetical protein
LGEGLIQIGKLTPKWESFPHAPTAYPGSEARFFETQAQKGMCTMKRWRDKFFRPVFGLIWVGLVVWQTRLIVHGKYSSSEVVFIAFGFLAFAEILINNQRNKAFHGLLFALALGAQAMHNMIHDLHSFRSVGEALFAIYFVLLAHVEFQSSPLNTETTSSETSDLS